jgi:CRP-like cAMP-binding protein
MYANSLLRALPPDVVERLRPEKVTFELRHEIEFPGKPIHHLFFLESGMASMTATFEDGEQVEVGMFGFESIIGVSALMGTRQSLNRVYTQIAGDGFRITLARARMEFQRGEIFQSLALRYVQAQLLQAMQSAGCNAKHEVNQRLARWLLLCADRVQSNTFLLSQEFLGDMLGVRRTSVTMAALTLRQAGLISYSRGKINILDVPGLKAVACECYQVIKDHLDSYTEFDTSLVR